MDRILFVDDEVRVLYGLQNSLRRQRRQWEMMFVSSAERALVALEKARFDVLVTDIRMPGMDGVALLRRVRARYPDVRCLALSGHAEEGSQREAESIVFRFLRKPCDPAALRGAIQQALDASEPAHEHPDPQD